MAEESRKKSGGESVKTDETRTVYLPILKDTDEDKVVIINGYRYVIQRGVEVEVPLPVYEVLKHEEKMQRVQAEYEAELRRRRKQKVLAAE